MIIPARLGRRSRLQRRSLPGPEPPGRVEDFRGRQDQEHQREADQARPEAAGGPALGGVDGIVFTGGIGERAAEIRARICQGLSRLGLEHDVAANGAGGPCISKPSSAVSAWVVHTDEERMIAISVAETLWVFRPNTDQKTQSYTAEGGCATHGSDTHDSGQPTPADMTFVT